MALPQFTLWRLGGIDWKALFAAPVTRKQQQLDAELQRINNALYNL